MRGHLDPRVPDETARRLAQIGQKQSSQVTRAGPGDVSEPFGVNGTIQIRIDVVDDPPDDVVVRRGCGREHAHLRLGSGASQVGHEVPGHHPGQFGAVILRDKCQSEIQGTGDSEDCAGVDVRIIVES